LARSPRRLIFLIIERHSLTDYGVLLDLVLQIINVRLVENVIGGQEPIVR